MNPNTHFNTKSCFRVLHILDSFPTKSSVSTEAEKLQLILLNHFEDLELKEGRVSSNFAQVFY